MRGHGGRGRRRQVRHNAQAGGGEALAQGRQVSLEGLHVAVDGVGHPARQSQPVPGNRLGGQQRVVDTPQFYPDHQNHRQLQFHRQVRQGLTPVERHAPAAGTLDQRQIGALHQQAATETGQLRHRQPAPGLVGGNVGSDRRLQCHRVDLLVGQ